MFSSPHAPQFLTRRAALRCGRARRLPPVAIRPVFVALATVLSTGCAHNVPLGGTAVGRGQPMHEIPFEVTTGLGFLPNIAGTAPELSTEDGRVANPVRSGNDLILRYPEIIDLGITFSTGHRADFGWSLSRGLHGMVEVARARSVSFSLSPALFWWKRRDSFSSVGRGTTRNLNLTALVSSRHVLRQGEAGKPGTVVEAWVGGGLNRFRLELAASGDTVRHAASPPSAVAGVNLMVRRLRIGAEFGGVWIRQRGRTRQIAPTFRLYLAVARGKPRRR